MFRLKVGLTLAALAAVVLVAPRPASAQLQQPVPVTVTVDEFGNGIAAGPSASDTLPVRFIGGAPQYVLPFFPVEGLVILTEPGQDLATVISDEILFTTIGGGELPLLEFFSDSADGVDAPADTGLLDPATVALIPNKVTIPEVGPEGENGVFYTPTSDQPGFSENPGLALSYHFISDVPEPASLGLLLTGGLPLFGFLRRRRA